MRPRPTRSSRCLPREAGDQRLGLLRRRLPAGRCRGVPESRAEDGGHSGSLGVPTLCMQTGMPLPNMTKIDQIKQVVSKVYAPIIAYAKDKGIKIAIENWFETCLQGIDTFECLLETSRTTTSASTMILSPDPPGMRSSPADPPLRQSHLPHARQGHADRRGNPGARGNLRSRLVALCDSRLRGHPLG